MQAASSVAAIVGAERVEVVIGGTTFYQEELGIQQAAEVADGIVQLLTEASQAGALDTKAIEAMDTADVASILPVLSKLSRLLPQLVGDVFASVLVLEDGSSLSTEDRALVARRLKLRQAMAMVKTFIAQNDIPDVVASFFSTRDAVSQGLRDLSTAAPVPMTESSSQPS